MGDSWKPQKSDFTLKGGLDPREHVKRIKGLFNPEINTGAADAAAAMEADRRRMTDSTTARIDNIFDSPDRQVQYDDFVNALRQRAAIGIAEQKRVTDLNRTFDIARRGLTGGSRDVDTQRQAARQHQENVLGAESKTQDSLNDLKSRDAASRENLVGLANNGLDASTAAARAITSLQQNTSMAKDAAVSQGVGDTLAAGAGYFADQQQGKAYNAGRQSIYG